jgi:hypothetical protein
MDAFFPKKKLNSLTRLEKRKPAKIESNEQRFQSYSSGKKLRISMCYLKAEDSFVMP